MTAVNGLIALLCASHALFAQQTSIGAQETARARELLNSPAWPTKAWGAYFVGRLHSDEAAQALIDQLARAALLRNSPTSSLEHDFVTVLLGAAIESGVTVPAQLLVPFEEGWTDPTLILLARSKDNEDVLLRLRSDKSQDPVWLAVNNLLFEKKSQRWYEAILGEIGITHRFTVTDPDRGTGVPAGTVGDITGDGLASVVGMPRGFPPVALYALHTEGASGDVLLATGPQNVYYRRTLVPAGKHVVVGPYFSRLDRMADRIGYLAQLRRQPLEEVKHLFRSETQIQYTNAEDFQRQVELRMAAQEQGIRALIWAIGKIGVRAPELHLRIVPQVADMRQETKDALPAVHVRDFELH